MEQIRTFEGGLNTDDSLETMSPADYPYLLNGIKSKSADGKRGSIENMIGTSSPIPHTIAQLTPASVCIGAIRDQKSNAWYVFFSGPSCIVKLGIGALTREVGNLTLIASFGALGFSPTQTISGFVAEDVLYFIASGPLGGIPMAINVKKYADPLLAPAPLTIEDILLMKRGPFLPPTFVKGNGPVDLNLTGKFGFQFAYQYEYEDHQFSVLSPYSILCPKNTRNETFNQVRISIHAGRSGTFDFSSSAEPVPHLVSKIRFAARIGNIGAWFYIGEYPKRIWDPAPLVPYQIDEVVFYDYQWWQAKTINTGVVPVEGADWTGTIGLTFFNNTNGAVVPSIYNVPYHLVPKRAKCMELIKNRLWLANYLEGYNTPADVGMTVIQQPFLPSTLGGPVLTTKSVFIANRETYTWDATLAAWSGPFHDFMTDTEVPLVEQFNGIKTSSIVFLVDPISVPDAPDHHIEGRRIRGHPDGYWEPDAENDPFISPAGYASPPAGVGAFDGEIRYSYTFQPLGIWGSIQFRTGYLPLAALSDAEGRKTFPSGSSYRIGYVLKDDLGRDLGGVITSNAASENTINTPKLYYNAIDAIWTLPATGFPQETRSYSIVMSRNLSKSFFLEHRSVQTRYFGNGAYSTAYNAGAEGIALDVTPIFRAGIGYEFIEGDRILLYPTQTASGFNIPADTTTVWDLPIKAFTGAEIQLPNVNVGTFNAISKTTFEIYRPIKEPSEILFYEIGQAYPVTYDLSLTAVSSIVTNVIKGDSVNTVRPTFKLVGTDYVQDDPPYHEALFKAMSTDPAGAWDTDIGKAYIKTTIGEVQKDNYFRHSATIINDTNVNGLSEFYFEDEGNVPHENGPINKLKSTARQANEGNVLLAIGRNETASIYVGEQRMTLDGSTSFMIQQNTVIGGVQTLKSNSYGTVHPDSVYDFGGNVYWWDAIREKVVRYASNGLFAISDFKMIDHFEDTARANSYARVSIGYDPYYRLFFITHSDGVTGRRTVSYSEEQKRWISFHSFEPEFYLDLDGICYSILNGAFHPHTNVLAFNNFYGTPYNTVLELNFNDAPASPKYWSAVSLLLSKNFWTWIAGEQKVTTNTLKFELENDFGQATDVIAERFDYDENVGYAALPKDRNTGAPAIIANPYVNGDDMFSHIATGRLTIIGQPNDVHKRINFVKVGFELSKGHTL